MGKEFAEAGMPCIYSMDTQHFTPAAETLVKRMFMAAEQRVWSQRCTFADKHFDVSQSLNVLIPYNVRLLSTHPKGQGGRN